MNQWQPIETAPKDGTPVLLAEPWKDAHLRYIGRWGKYGWMKNERNPSYYTKRMNLAFDHWMPLPEPPK